MKKNETLSSVMTLCVVASIIIAGGCSVKQSVVIREIPGGFQAEGTSYGLLPPPSPREMAEAYNIKRESDREDRQLDDMIQNRTTHQAANKKYLVVAINHTDKPAEVFNPESGKYLPLGKGSGYQFLALSRAPERITFKNAEGQITYEFKVDEAKFLEKRELRVFKGREVDLTVNLTRQ